MLGVRRGGVKGKIEGRGKKGKDRWKEKDGEEEIDGG